ncbi:FLYWCH-type zinc finger-containing protein 1-like [Bacillus rossius redtenbacheri]|uniref:FLYWCH-type zinc finger-containing protein 1-like n=1 Tax=Bacillus rossius redtenbacheri TaxID=93214 RepID=UPI002FDE00AD
MAPALTLCDLCSAGAFSFVVSSRGNPQLVFNDYLFKSECLASDIGQRKFWRCIDCNKTRCHARIITHGHLLEARNEEHNHPPHTEIIERKPVWNRLNQFSDVHPHSRSTSTVFADGVHFVPSSRGNRQLVHDNYLFKLVKVSKGGERQTWRCVSCNKTKCRARVVTEGHVFEIRCSEHNHAPHTQLIERNRMWNVLRHSFPPAKPNSA